MADEPGADPLDEQAEEEGGPVKSFLEHLEDLRWVLIKSCAAAGVAMLGCLLAGNYVVRIVEWPLSRAPIKRPQHTQSARVLFGTNQLGIIQVQHQRSAGRHHRHEPLCAVADHAGHDQRPARS